MSDLLDTVLEAHGGLARWRQLESVSARLIQGGALWALKGQPGVLDDVIVTASLHEERVSHRLLARLTDTARSPPNESRSRAVTGPSSRPSTSRAPRLPDTRSRLRG